MNSEAAIEAWLRPPVELWTAVVASGTAMVALGAPWALMMPPPLGYATSVLVGGLAILRAKQGLRIVRYQRNMRRLPVLVVRSKDLPVSDQMYYVGRGFRWTQKHTQRLRDAMRPEAAEFLCASDTEALLRRFESWSDRTRHLQWLARHTAAPSWWNPYSMGPALGGDPRLHGVELNEADIMTSLAERVGHILVLGATRVGKTRLLEILATQDIRRGDTVIVFDPKGDPDLFMRVVAEAKAAGREDQLTVFHLGFPEICARYNAIGNFSRITEVASRATSPLPSSGNSAAFKEFAWRFVNIIARALVALGEKPDYRRIQTNITDIDALFARYARKWLGTNGTEDWAQAVERLARRFEQPKNMPRHLVDRAPESVALLHYLKDRQMHEPVLDGLSTVFKYERAYFDKIVSSLGPLLEKLTTGKIAELIAPDYFDIDDPRPIFDWMSVLKQRGIVYLGLDALTDSVVAAAVGNSMFADLVAVSGHLYKHGTESYVDLHLDEFNELMGEEFVPMVNKSGGAGYRVAAYTQTSADIEVKAGSAPRAEQVIGNFNTLISLRVKNIKTARLLTDQLPDVEVNALTMVSGATDSSSIADGIDFTSRNEDRVATQTVPLWAPSDVMSLPKGQAFALLDGGQPYKLRFPLPGPIEVDGMPGSFQALITEMRQKYRTGEQWWLGADGDGSVGSWDGAPSENEWAHEEVV